MSHFPRLWSGILYLLILLSQTVLLQAAEKQGMIVADGQARAQIVMSADAPPMVQLAARELQRHLAAMTGATLEISHVPADPPLVNIFVGQCDALTKLGVDAKGLVNDAYRMKTGDYWLALVGDDDEYEPPTLAPVNRAGREQAQAKWDAMTGELWLQPFPSLFKSYNRKLDIWACDGKGTINAVYAWLRTLGAEWYMPGDIGSVLPRHTDIALEPMDKTVQADFEMRDMLFYAKTFDLATEEEILWQLQLGLTRRNDFVGSAPFGHGMSWVHGRPEYTDRHPEQMALYGSQRATKGESKPCLSNPQLFDATVRFVKDIFRYTGEPSVSVMPPDGYTSVCQCELCKGKAELDQPWNGQMSNYVWTFVNHVAQEVYKTYPDRTVSNFAYGTFTQPPTAIDRLSPNVLLGIVSNRSAMNDEADRKAALALRAGWEKLLASSDRKYMLWQYYLTARPKSYPNVPVYFPHAISWDLKSLKGKAYGDFIEVFRDQQDAHLIVDSLTIYTTSRLWWNADQDVDALLARYYTDFYGPAGEAMQAFVAFSEANWREMPKDPALIRQMFVLLEKVKAAAPVDTVYAQRVKLLADYLQPLERIEQQLISGRQDNPRIRIVSRHGMDVKLDGVLDEEAWKVGKHWLKDVQTGKLPRHNTQFIAFWKQNTLYLGITASEPDQPDSAARENDDSNIWSGDNIEILLETQSNAYYQIVVSPNGKVMDLNRDGGFNTTWNSNLRVATGQSEGAWVLEIAIPLADEQAATYDPTAGVAGRQPSEKFPWYINVCRQRLRGEERELSAYAPTGKQQFHDPQKFARIWVK